MSEFKAVLLDVDGVLNEPGEYFSRRYAAHYGIDGTKLEEFFNDDFRKTSVGEADLAELITRRQDLWQWTGSVQDLLSMWFQSENNVNQALVQLIAGYRQAGLKVYIATVQERWRAHYLKTVMFPGGFDGFFASCDLGCLKDDPAFFIQILTSISQSMPDLTPEQIVYFDDTQDGLATAAAMGITAQLYESVDQVAAVLG